MKKIFGYFVILMSVFVMNFGMTSCEEVGEPSSPIVGFWEDVDDSEHCFIFGNHGDFIDGYRQQYGEKYGIINNTGNYYYTGTEITFANPYSKKTHMYYITKDGNTWYLKSSVSDELIVMKRTRDNRGLIFNE